MSTWLTNDFLLAALQLIIGPIIAILVQLILTYKKKLLQMVFTIEKRSNRTTTVFTLRNVSNDCVFIDKIFLYKVYSEKIDLSEKFGIKKESLILEPSKSMVIKMSESEIQKYFTEMCNKCGLDNKKEYRLGFKILIYSSSGTLTTTWFKLGRNKDTKHWIAYHFFEYKYHYYNMRRKIIVDPITVKYRTIILLILLSIIDYCVIEVTGSMAFAIIFYVVALILAIIVSMDGYKRRLHAVPYSLLSSVPAILLITLAGMPIEAIVIISTVVILANISIMHHYSGWNL